MQSLLRCYAKKTDISLTCHQLRHTFARRLTQERMPTESIGKLLGHSQLATTQRYTADADPDLRDASLENMAQLEPVGSRQEATTPLREATSPGPGRSRGPSCPLSLLAT